LGEQQPLLATPARRIVLPGGPSWLASIVVALAGGGATKLFKASISSLSVVAFQILDRSMVAAAGMDY
jgi:hypothetical protein